MHARLDTPATPWRLILYQDGIGPNDGLAKHQGVVLAFDWHRNSSAFYLSMLELGMGPRAHEEACLPVSLARTDIAMKLASDVAQLAHTIISGSSTLPALTLNAAARH